MLGKHPRFRKPSLVKRWHFTCRKVGDRADCGKEKRYNHSRKTRVVIDFLQQAYKAKGRHCGHEMFSFFLLRWFGILTGAPVFEHFVEGARQFVSALLIA